MNYTLIFGLVAATLTTISFLPQAIKVIRSKNTKDLSLPMYIILNSGILLWLIYGLLIHDLPIIICNTITLIFTGTILVMKLRYK